MYKPQKLNSEQFERCMNTVSSNAFYMIVADSLVRREGLSVIRMADGEKILMNICLSDLEANAKFNEEWLTRYGIKDIPKDLLLDRMLRAINGCDYYSPSISGVVMGGYNVDSYRHQERYIDNFFPNAWFESMKINLYQEAGHVLIIHRNPNTANALISRADKYLGVKVSWLELSSWQQADGVIEQAAGIDAPLVIFSGGPANKYIGPEIAKHGKVTLDIGQAMDRWTLLPLHQEKEKLRENNI